ncbi:MAG: exonuclease domain-containing protein [Acidimicrobiia bacterium]
MDFDRCGSSIYDTTFVVLDLETTGISPQSCAITEFAAQKIRGGEIISSLSILVNPKQKIPIRISVLNGLTNDQLEKYPTIDELLPTIIEFIGNNVIVGHNVRFDISFINAALKKYSYEQLTNKYFDTLNLAKKLLHKEVRNYKLSTLSAYINTQTQPTHRALDDVKATTELFHYLIERSSSMGISGVNDLSSIPSVNKRASFIKRKMANDIPNCPGVYFFVGENEKILYIGKSIRLKDRLRSYFTSDERTKILRLIRQTKSIKYLTTKSELEARIAELRLIKHFQPEFNTADKGNRKLHYLILDNENSAPYLKITSSNKAKSSFKIGPFNKRRDADTFRSALNIALGIRDCTNKCEQGLKSSNYSCLSSKLNGHSCFCFNEWEGIEQYKLNVIERLSKVFDEPTYVTNILLKKMQAHSEKLEFEKASKYLHHSQIFQKWINRFISINTTKNCCTNENGLNIINGIIHVEASNPEESQLVENCISIIKDCQNATSDEATLIQKDNEFFVSPANEFIERFYLASFLTKNNFLNKKLSA